MSEETKEEEQDGYTRIKADDLKLLRSAKDERDTLRKEIEPLRQRAAVADAKLPDLTPKRLRALFAAIDGDVTPESIRSTAVELGYIQDEAPEVNQDEEAAKGAQSAAKGARDGSQHAANGLFTHADFAKLSPQKRREFANTRREDMVKLKQGEAVKQ